MTISAPAVVWTITGIGFAVLLVLAALQVGRAVRDAKRLQRRLTAIAELPVIAAAARAERNARRLDAALTLVPPLVLRAQAALAAIRRGPVPPDAVIAFRRIAAALGALRTLARP